MTIKYNIHGQILDPKGEILYKHYYWDNKQKSNLDCELVLNSLIFIIEVI